MKIRFIEYKDDLYVVIGMTWGKDAEEFEAVPLNEFHPTIFQALIEVNTVRVPLAEAIEITDKNRLLSLMILYGY